jgi:hypothetical protein
MKLTKILESVLTTEIGDSTKGYEYQLDLGKKEDLLQKGGQVEYSFKDDNEVEYSVDVMNKNGYLYIEFSIPYGNPSDSSHGASNFGDQYKVMGTIVNIIRDIINLDTRGSIKGIEYNPTYKSSERGSTNKGAKKSEDPINKRDRLYRVYIQRAFPNWNVKFTDTKGSIIAHFPIMRRSNKK